MGKATARMRKFFSLLNTLRRSFPCLQSISLQSLAPEALAVDVEHGGVIKDTVKGAEQRVFFIEILSTGTDFCCW